MIQPLLSRFEPGVDRSTPYVLELASSVPGRSSARVSVSYEKSLLKWLEYPPDANHGFYIGSALSSAVLPSNANATSTVGRSASTYAQHFAAKPEEEIVVQLYTESLLVNLPTPDFSMPYNVICLACTVVALAFGPLHNITTKNLVVEKGEEQKGFVGRLVDNVKAKLPFLRKKEEAEKSEEEEEEDEESEKDK